MLFLLLLMHLMLVLVNGEGYKENKPYIVVPVPLDFPNRNDRSEQCWLRIEDVEIIDTITVYCYMAQDFLHNFIQDYNTRKMIEDKVDVTSWDEEPYQDVKPFSMENNRNGRTSWKLVTVMDLLTNRRLYVTKNADCKLIMYSREGMTSYKVKCDEILYFINTNDGVTSRGCVRVWNSLIIVLFLVIILSLDLSRHVM